MGENTRLDVFYDLNKEAFAAFLLHIRFGFLTLLHKLPLVCKLKGGH